MKIFVMCMSVWFHDKLFCILALPKPVGLFPLDKTFGGKDVVNKENGLLKNVQLTNGPDGKIDQSCTSDHDCCIVLIISIKSSK